MQNAVAEIVLNRPDKMNALNNAMMAELGEAFDRRRKSAGARDDHSRRRRRRFAPDVISRMRIPATRMREEILERVFNPVIRRLADFPAPTFAAVHGACLGVGLGLALG